MSRASEIIATGDMKRIIGMALDARLKANADVFCLCESPDLVGEDLMCGNCLLENRGQREAKERRMREPHAFVTYFPSGKSLTARDREHWEGIGMCAVCSYWRDDSRHG